MKALTKTKNKVFILFFILTILWIFARLPSPAQTLADADGGHQLAGAIQILHGEHPFVDYEATYGPFTFYASALAQIIFDNRIIGEIALVTLGYAIAYALLARMMYHLSGNFWLTLLFGIFALAAIPRLYKYYLVLGPVLTLFSIWNYLEKPKEKNILWMALAITFAGLFRSDFGVYCTIAGVLGVFIQPSYRQGNLKRILILLGEILLFALPWLLFLTFRGGLVNYFRDMLVGGTNIAIGMSLPFPVFHPELSILALKNLNFFAATFFFATPFIIFIWLFIRWGFIAPVQKKMLLVAATLNLFSLLQASHRADYAHLLQTIPLAFLLSAGMVNQLGNNLLAAFRAKQKIWLAYGASLALFLGFLLVPVSLINQSGWPPIDFSGLSQKLAQFSLSKQQLLDGVNAKSDSWYAQTMLYIRRCTTDQQRLMALPALTTFPYFTDRSFGGGQIGVLSGYFVTDQDQSRVVRKMSAQDIPLIIYLPNFEFDDIPERKLEVVAPKVADYIQANYTQLKQIGPASLLMRNNLKIDKPTDELANMSCPHP